MVEASIWSASGIALHSPRNMLASLSGNYFAFNFFLNFTEVYRDKFLLVFVGDGLVFITYTYYYVSSV